MIFLELQQDVWSRLNKPNPPDPQTQARIKSFINQRHRTLLTMPGLNQLRRDTLSLNSVPGQAHLALPQIVNRVDAIFERTNNRRLMEKPLDWLRTVDPRYASGTPTVYVARGYQYEHDRPVQIDQPATLGQLWAWSSVPGDQRVIRVEGLQQTQDWIQRAVGSATLAGATPVQILGENPNVWSQIYKVFLSAPAQAFVDVYLAQPGPIFQVGLARVPPGQVRGYQFIIQFWPIPTAVLTYVIDYTRVITDMVEDTDEPYLPQDFHDLLSIGARQDEYEKTDDDRARTAAAEWQQRYAALQYFLQGRQSARIIPYGMGGRTGWNNVNAWAPADFYL